MALHHEPAERPRPAGVNPLVVDANPVVTTRVVPPRDHLEGDPVAPDVAYQLVHDAP